MQTHPRHAALWPLVQPSPGDLAHDADHVLRVYAWCLRLAPEAGADVDLAGAAGLVHDLVNIPKESADRPLGGELSAVAGREPLTAAGYTEEEVAQIVEAVRTSSWSRGLAPTGPLGVVLQDADRLDAIGAIGAARNFACAQAMASRGQPGTLYHPTDPVRTTERPLDDRIWALDHWYRKLLLLSGSLRLPTAQAEGERRHAWLLNTLDQLEHELHAVGSVRAQLQSAPKT